MGGLVDNQHPPFTMELGSNSHPLPISSYHQWNWVFVLVTCHSQLSVELGREHDDQFSVPPVELGAVNTHSNWWSVDVELGSQHTFSMELVATYYSILSGIGKQHQFSQCSAESDGEEEHP